MLTEHHFDISVNPGQPAQYSHKLSKSSMPSSPIRMASGVSDCLLAIMNAAAPGAVTDYSAAGVRNERRPA